MGTFEIVQTVRADLKTTFEVFSDFRMHGNYIPLTRIQASDRPMGKGWRFTALSGFGKLALVDRMEITQWDPHNSLTVTKFGPVLDGWAQVHFTPEGDDTRVVWRENIVLRPATAGSLLAPVLDPGNRAMFARSIKKMAAAAEAR